MGRGVIGELVEMSAVCMSRSLSIDVDYSVLVLVTKLSRNQQYEEDVGFVARSLLASAYPSPTHTVVEVPQRSALFP